MSGWTEIDVIYASLFPGSRRGWLGLLAAGWSFGDPFAPAPMERHHGRYSVLMTRPVDGGGS